VTLAEFFLAVNASNVRLDSVGGRLQLLGLADVISPEIRAGAAEHEGAILALLSAGPLHEGEGEMLTTPEGFRHDHDWRDWRLEWLLELGTLALRMRGCEDQDVLARLRPLAEATPTSKTEWLALGRQITDTEHELRQRGKLPSYPWPERGEP
jgi:hypothetical protein